MAYDADDGPGALRVRVRVRDHAEHDLVTEEVVEVAVPEGASVYVAEEPEGLREREP